MGSSRDVILYNPDNDELFVSSEQKIKQAVDEITGISKRKTLTDEEIIKIIKGET